MLIAGLGFRKKNDLIGVKLYVEDTSTSDSVIRQKENSRDIY